MIRNAVCPVLLVFALTANAASAFAQDQQGSEPAGPGVQRFDANAPGSHGPGSHGPSSQGPGLYAPGSNYPGANNPNSYRPSQPDWGTPAYPGSPNGPTQYGNPRPPAYSGNPGSGNPGLQGPSGNPDGPNFVVVPDSPGRPGCTDCPKPRPHYDTQEVIHTTKDVDRSRVINTTSVVPVAPRVKETNHLVVRHNTIRNVGVVRHNHTIIEKEIRYRRPPAWKPRPVYVAKEYRTYQTYYQPAVVYIPVVYPVQYTAPYTYYPKYSYQPRYQPQYYYQQQYHQQQYHQQQYHQQQYHQQSHYIPRQQQYYSHYHYQPYY